MYYIPNVGTITIFYDNGSRIKIFLGLLARESFSEYNFQGLKPK